MVTFRNSRALVLGVAVGAALMLAGCSDRLQESPPAEDTFSPQATAEPSDVASGDQNAALDAYVALELEQADAVMEAYGDTYSDFAVEPQYPDTVLYTYTYADELDPEAAAAALDEVAATIKDGADSSIFPTMTQLGVVDPKLTFVYLNPDGTVLWSKTFEPS